MQGRVRIRRNVEAARAFTSGFSQAERQWRAKSVASRDTRAIQTKLDEIILTSRAENRFIGIENLDEGELKRLNALLGEAARRDRHARETALSAHDDGSEAGRGETDEAPPLERAAPR